MIFSNLLNLKFRLTNHRDYFIPREHVIAEPSSHAWIVNVAGNMTMVYGFDRRIWGIEYHLCMATTRGNHAQLVLQKGGNLHFLF